METAGRPRFSERLTERRRRNRAPEYRKVMNEKINRLAKGIIDSELPKAELSPASFSETVDLTAPKRMEFSLRSQNGVRLRGLVYSDNPRVRIENAIFTGGRNRIFFQVDPSFLRAGTVIFGAVCMITNAGEFRLPYRFTTEGASVYDRKSDEEEPQPFPADNDPSYFREPGKRTLSGEEEVLVSLFPEDPELFTELCALLIRERCTSLFAFYVYQEAVRRDVRLTRLYEYYLYALPEEFDRPIPREVLLYFSYDAMPDGNLQAVLYKNILLYQSPDSELYREYEPQIRDFALQSVFRQKTDENLAVIYAHMLYPDMIDTHVAGFLPRLLKTCRVRCMDRRMKRLIVRYPFLNGEEAYPLSDGTAYVPIYLPRAELLFEDASGRRYCGVKHTAEQLMEDRGLLDCCLRLCPAHPLAALLAADRLLVSGVHSETEKETLLSVTETLPLTERAREQAAERLIAYGGKMDFLSRIDLDRLPGAQKEKVIRELVRQGAYRSAFRFLFRYGLGIARKETLFTLCTGMLSGDHSFQEEAEERFFISACRMAFDGGLRDRTLLSYLARTYEGATEDMYAIFAAACEAGLRPQGLAERILITKLFAGSESHLDEVFAAYMGMEPREVLIRAYMSVRAADYFLSEKAVPEQFFRDLRALLLASGSRGQLPSIYLLAWTKHAAECAALTEQETELAAELLSVLVAEGLIFSYTAKLLRKLGIPSPVCEQSYIEYHGSKYRKPCLLVRIEPEDQDFRAEEMKRVYQGIYLKEIRLFSDDRLLYRIYDEDRQTLLAEGRIEGKSASEGSAETGSRCGLLNRMTDCLRRGEDAALLETMKAYILKDEITRALFDAG